MTDFQRILVAGGPRTGKTTLADALAAGLGVEARHTDDLIDKLEWSELSAEVANWLNEPGPWVIEGVRVVHAVRKWLAKNAEGLPCDVLYWSEVPKVELEPRHRPMTKGVKTVWSEVVDPLFARGATFRGF